MLRPYAPKPPLAHADIWLQIGHVYEQQKDYVRAKVAFERGVADNPHHAKVLQRLGWLYHQDGSSFQNQDLAVTYLTKSLETDPSDAQSWYLLGRAYMAGQNYNNAHMAYQQAVYRDHSNPAFWGSIGNLFSKIYQSRDALDAYTRAIHINPCVSEVWFDVGALYESHANISDAIVAYERASELDPNNPVITQRLQQLRNAQATGGQLSAPRPTTPTTQGEDSRTRVTPDFKHSDEQEDEEDNSGESVRSVVVPLQEDSPNVEDHITRLGVDPNDSDPPFLIPKCGVFSPATTYFRYLEAHDDDTLNCDWKREYPTLMAARIHAYPYLQQRDDPEDHSLPTANAQRYVSRGLNIPTTEIDPCAVQDACSVVQQHPVMGKLTENFVGTVNLLRLFMYVAGYIS